MLADIHLSHTITNSDLYDNLSGYIIEESSIAGDNHGLSVVLMFWKSIENRLHEILKIVSLGEYLHLLSKTACAWLLIHIRLCFHHSNMHGVGLLSLRLHLIELLASLHVGLAVNTLIEAEVSIQVLDLHVAVLPMGSELSIEALFVVEHSLRDLVVNSCLNECRDLLLVLLTHLFWLRLCAVLSLEGGAFANVLHCHGSLILMVRGCVLRLVKTGNV